METDGLIPVCMGYNCFIETTGQIPFVLDWMVMGGPKNCSPLRTGDYWIATGQTKETADMQYMNTDNFSSSLHYA